MRALACIERVFNSGKKPESLACEARSLGYCKVSWVAAARRPPLPTDGTSHLAQEEVQQSSLTYTMQSKKGLMNIKDKLGTRKEAYDKGVSKIGSSPPSCENKCYGCVPCEAIQVPSKSNLSIQYSNYEPESWKCKCGLSFHSP
ncbi:hypothetical protein RIF29_10743 [Crotalaria pallida]|uniref:Epidermal patterning factor-like protein n=1 Tax=Crotalaria pallida TaxID=3830 RepID=A0AAN9IK65_CROPI